MAPGTILDKNLESGVHLEVLADQRGSGDQKQTSELVVLGPQKSCNTNNFYPTNTRVGVETAPTWTMEMERTRWSLLKRGSMDLK